jgi:hypothetical protein
MIDTSAPAFGLEIAVPASKAESLTRAVAIAAALVFQILALYASVLTFGGWYALAIYAVGAIAVVLQHAVARRRARLW